MSASVVAHWSAQLKDAPSIELSITNPTTDPNLLAGHLELELGAVDPLEAVAAAEYVSLSDVLLAAYAALLHRYSGQSDLPIGVLDNDGPGVVVRAQVEGGEPFATLVGSVYNAGAVAAFNKDYALEDLVLALGVGRTDGRHPLYQVAFAFDVEVPTGETTPYDLLLAVWTTPSGLRVRADYNAGRYDRDAIERLLTHFRVLLDGVGADASVPVDALPLMSPSERDLVVVEWNRTAREFPQDRCLHELVEAQVDRDPAALAVFLDGVTLTFGELEQRANQLAHHLQSLGAGPEVRVGVFVERSLEMVVSVLAILKAGAAYVPIETKSPQDRIAFILADASVPVLITQDRLLDQLGAQATTLVRIDGDWSAIAHHPATRPRHGATADTLAYVIYTSGSTGRPKGVQVEHRMIVNLVCGAGAIESMVPTDRCLQFSSVAFDSSVDELFTPLAHGAALVLRGEDVPGASDLFGARFAGVTVMNIPTAYWHTLAAALKSSELTPPPALRLVNIGGERALPEHVRIWGQLAPGCTLNNFYGPTEATVMATGWKLQPEQLRPGREVPIGVPLPNYTVYVLDVRQQPVPIGIAGEVYIGGASVARGYLDRPELTAEKFLPNPFGPGRMYRTGDLARWAADGNIEFVGRADEQVKIRGYRIELGEIEGALSSVSGVQECVVIAREDQPGIKRLVAYVVGDPSIDLRAQLGVTLPPYMIPSAFIWLDHMPVTAMGKVDRKALPLEGDAGTQRPHMAPEGEMEQTLAAIWCELLGLERVGRDDNFFELGGHSLLAVQLMERLRKLGFSSDALFAAPTLADLAASLERHETIRVPPNLIAAGSTSITPDQLTLIELTQADIGRIAASVPGGIANIQDIYALSPLQEGMLFHHQLSEEDPYLYIAHMTFPDRDLVDRYMTALQRVVDRHDILRTAFVWQGLSTAAQVVLRQARMVVEELELDPTGQPGHQQLAHRYHPRRYRMDLSQAPLMRYVVAKDPTSDRWLVVQVAHHLIGDHESPEIIHHETGAMMTGRDSELVEPEPFRNLIAEVRLGVSESEHEQFFREMLGDVDEPTIPFGVSDVHGVGADVGEAKRWFSSELNTRLRAQSRRIGVSLASVFHVAWGLVMSHVSSACSPVVFGTVMFGRARSGGNIDRAMGLYINTLPFRIDIDGVSVEDAVHQAQTTLSRLMRHEQASLPLAQRCSRVHAAVPLFSTLLNYRHNRYQNQDPSHPMHVVEWYEGEERTNYPFMLHVEDGGEDSLGITAQVLERCSPERVCGLVERALETIVDAIEHAPATHLRELDLLPEDERRDLVVTRNETAREYPALALHALVERQVDRTPDAVAVVGEQTLTYAALDRRANQVAHHLIALGVIPGSRVTIFLERTTDLVVAILGVLKTGAAYVPLDPTYPADRLAFIQEDAEAHVMITQTTLVGRLPDVGSVLVRMDEQDAAIAKCPTTRCFVGVGIEQLSHVIYTSGSTGRPKGVAIEHRVMSNFCQFAHEVQPAAELESWLFATSVCFDMSLYEMFVPLSAGGRIVVVDNLFGAPGKDVTFVNAVPSVMAAYLATNELPPTVKAVSCAGEPLSNALVEQLHAAGAARVYDWYGPTETFIATWCVRSGKGAPTIGRPAANLQAYVLDSNRRLVPQGAPGELYFAGHGLARGYLDRDDLTAERFVANPFGAGRIYKTGDLAQWLPDGTLAYLGRSDHQVKIRGFRIEPGEIETRLAEHPHVREVVVIARGTDSERRLIAFYTTDGDAIDGTELRAFIQARVPDYMVPARIIVLDRLPRLPNGKLDRTGLPDDVGPLEQETYAAPRTALELQLAALWVEVLRVERVGRDDDFFALGGHSLLATQLVSRIRRAFDVKLSIRSVFESRTVAELARTIECTTSEVTLPLEVVARDGDLEASFGQQRMWLVAQLGERDAYDMSTALRITGELDVGAIAGALAGIVARHEVLRTTFTQRGGRLVQRIEPPRDRELVVIEVPSYDAAVEHCRAGTQRPYDLDAGPVFEAKLLRIDPRDHVLSVRMHHIAGDEWSYGVLANELAALYQGRELPPLRIQYADFAAWQRALLDSGALDRQLAYWRDRLAGAPARLELPTDRPRPAALGGKGAEVRCHLPMQLWRAIEKLGLERSATPFMTLLAAFHTLLHRYTGEQDICVGTPVANRDQPGTEGMIGFFLNTVVLRADLSGAPTFLDVLERVRDAALGAFAHQDLPFDRVVEEFQLGRDLSHTPLFQVMFVFQRILTPLVIPGLRFEDLELDNDSSKFELTMYTEERSDGLAVSCEFNTDLFDATTIERMLGHYRALLEAVVANPSRRIGELAILDDNELRLLLAPSDPAREFSRDTCLHELFEARVDASPDATAVWCDGVQLTYRELDDRANQLARHLIDAGIGPDMLVAMLVERSLDMIVGILGILKAGGAYVPLDPAYPADRLAFMMADAAPHVVLTHSRMTASLPPHQGRVVLLDDDAVFRTELVERVARRARSSHLAYVIYTSGSTGRPKGVQITHHNVTRLFAATWDWFRFDEHDVWTLFHSYAFDFSVWEIWGALLYGGRLVVVPHLVSRSPEEFRELLSAQRVTVLNQTPSAFYELVHADQRASSPLSLRLVIFGGEALSFSKLRPWFERHDDRSPALVNMYGITETTVHVTYRPITANDVDSPANSAIGRTIPDLQLYVLDRNMQLVPIGVAGELYVGGEGLARGYLNRPELTEQRFVANPFGNGRLYKTGDLARWLPGGELDYMGRIDHQVKIRGFRIELGEIETVLGEHPSVREVVVVAREDRPGDKQLVAYVVGREGTDVDELRAHARLKLPEHMVPPAFVVLKSLPLTTNGKLDRKALPAPDDKAVVQRAYAAPLGQVEVTLAAVWCELLGLEQVGRHDHFFELGGHSLLAIRLVDHLRRRDLGIELRNLFATPTLAELAATLTNHREVIVPANEIRAGTPITPAQLPLISLLQSDIDRIVVQVPGGLANVQDIYALSPLQEGMLFHHQIAGEGDPYLLREILAFPGRALLDRYLGAVQQVVDRHDILRTAFVWEGLSIPAQVVWREATLVVTELQLDPAGPSGVEELVGRFDPRRHRMDLTRAPLLRFAIAQEPRSERWLVVVLSHHLIDDFSTLTIMNAEVKAILAGRGGELAPPVQFRTLVAQALQGIPAEEHEQFFRSLLADIDGPTIPFGLADVHLDGTQVGEAHRTLPSALHERLRRHVRRLGVSLASLCHLAWGLVVARTSGRDQVVFGTVLFGRMHSGASDTAMGPYINTLPIRLDLDGTTVEASVRRTHGVLGGLLRHEHAPLALAQRCSGVPSGTPLFSALLNYRNDSWGLDADDGQALPIEWLEAEERTNYPLTLSVDEQRDTLSLTAQVMEPISPERVCDFMERALDQLAEALEHTPDLPVRALDVLPPTERSMLLETWNDTAAPYPRDRCIHELFEAQVDRDPDAVAAVLGSDQLTYGELERRANQLAHHLIDAGVGPDVRVGIYVERSLDMVVGVLGILKAGGAYVPLDPKLPAERLAFVLEDAALPVVLVQDHLATRVTRPNTHLVRLDTDWPQIALHPNARPRSAVRSENLAYVIYTSGSTGRPKGVLIEHRMVVNFTLGLGEHERIGPSDRVSQLTSLSFDGSVLELFPALCFGAALVLRGEDLPSADELFGERFGGVTVMFLTTSYWHAVVGTAPPPSLRLVVIGGDRALPEYVRTWHALAPNCELLNLYGPTEATVAATAAYLTADRLLPGREVPIGRPLPNYQVYVLDARGVPLPVGVTGELYIGGDGIGRGYLDRPELTAERFVANPFGPGRLYRTGDFARWFPDGNLEFIGRIDDQVKIRGFRVELGEIEAALALHASVREVVVVAREDRPGDKQLVAYVVGREGAEIDELRAHARLKLPEHMVPPTFVMLTSLPLTTSGKLDRKALPAPDAQASVQRAYVAPLGEVEVTLAAVWCELLGVEQVGLHDHFFELGGHSLLAMRLVSRIRQLLQVALSVRNVFESPTVAALAKAIEGATGSAPRPIEVVARDGALEASFGQQRMWLGVQLGERDAYDMSTPIRIRGALDASALARALDGIVARHEVLRTTFVEETGRLVQHIAPPRARALPIVEVTSYEDALAHCRITAQRPYDLATGPIFEPALLRITPTDHVLVLRMHHIAGDEWSIGVFLDELAALYQGRDLPPLPIQYADFAAWQRAWLASGVLDRQIAYWRDRLVGAPARLEIPTDRPCPAVLGSNGALVRCLLPVELWRSLEKLGLERSATPFMTLLAALHTLLHRYTGEHDICVGTPVANRNQPGTESLIGFFLNTVVMRADLSGSPTFEGVLARVRDAALGAYAHADVPFDRIVEELQPDRNSTQPPLLQIMFVFTGLDRGRTMIPGLDLEMLDVEANSSKFELTLFTHEHDDGLECSIEFNTDLFDTATIERMLGHYRTLLEGIVADPTRPIGDLPIMNAGELEQIVVDWNATRHDYPRDRCIHELFEAQVDRDPAAIAVVSGGEQLTYGELEARANQLAHELISAGVGAEVPVLIYLRRSFDMIVGVLATLKAGGAYVPLDPSTPRDRVGFVIEDAGVPVVITERALAARVAGLSARVIEVDAERAVIERQPQTRPSNRVGTDNLAYVIYTSGSTGQPKGVEIEHRMVVNFTLAIGDNERFGPSDRMSQVASLAFDGSVLEVFGALCFGAALVLRGEDLPSAAELFGEQFRGVTVMFLPTSYWHAVSSAQPSPSLRLVVIGGDRALPDHVRSWNARAPGCELLNVYGPTETTVGATTEHLVAEVLLPGREAPIGKPMANYQVYLLDKQQQPVPIGVAGELYIGGAGVGRGYLKRPGLNAERFLPNPLGEGRVYRTGDLARWRPDGRIEFVGRADNQVKIRGFRVELGEIEATLSRHDGVDDIVVIARDEVGGDKRLVAYVVGSATHHELEAHLAITLPTYMIPSVFITLPSLPLTSRGKVDHRALPVPGAPSHATVRLARTRTELEVAQIVAALLRVPTVAPDDNFFLLGGHSLLATRLVAQVKDRLGVEVRMSTLFRAPTIEAFAREVDDHRQRQTTSSDRATSPLIQLSPAGSRTPIVCVHPIGGTVFCYQPLAARLHDDRGWDAFEARGLDGSPEATSIPEIARHYADELLAVRGRGPIHLVGWSFGGVVALEMRSLLAAVNVEVRSTTMIDSYPPAVFTNEPADAISAYVVLAADLGLEVDEAELRGLGEAAAHARIAGLVHAAGAGLKPAELEVRANVIRAHLQALRGFAPSVVPSDARVVLIKAADGDALFRAPEYGWSSIIPNLEVRESPGTHHTMLTSPNLEALCACLEGLLER